MGVGEVELVYRPCYKWEIWETRRRFWRLGGNVYCPLSLSFWGEEEDARHISWGLRVPLHRDEYLLLVWNFWTWEVHYSIPCLDFCRAIGLFSGMEKMGHPSSHAPESSVTTKDSYSYCGFRQPGREAKGTGKQGWFSLWHAPRTKWKRVSISWSLHQHRLALRPGEADAVFGPWGVGIWIQSQVKEIRGSHNDSGFNPVKKKYEMMIHLFKCSQGWEETADSCFGVRSIIPKLGSTSESPKEL